MDELNLSRSGKEKVDPPPEEIEAAVRAVGAGEDFVILERAEKCWLQYDGRDLEYRDGERIHRADLESPVANTFRAYAEGGDAWREQWSWRDVTEEVFANAERGRRRAIFGVVALLLGFAVLTYAVLSATGVL